MIHLRLSSSPWVNDLSHWCDTVRATHAPIAVCYPLAPDSGARCSHPTSLMGLPPYLGISKVKMCRSFGRTFLDTRIPASKSLVRSFDTGRIVILFPYRPRADLASGRCRGARKTAINNSVQENDAENGV
jgi:hypothetical protein